MARDPEFHEFATRFPRGVLALLGLDPLGEYEVDSVVVKTSERRIDLVFQPVTEQDPWVYMEYQAWSDPQVERRLLKEVVDHCVQRGEFDRVVAAVIYARQEFADAALLANIGRAGRSCVVTFAPLRLVLTHLDPNQLLAAGEGALVALPLVGTEDEVMTGAATWRQEIERTPEFSESSRSAALDLFYRFLAWRFDRSRIDIETLLPLEADVAFKDTVTGQRILAEGRAAGFQASILALVEAKLESVPAGLADELGRVSDPARLEALHRQVIRVETLEDLRGILDEWRT